MDSQKRDESQNRSREEALARRMGMALDRLSPRDAGECPDADLIAAYHERTLEPEEHSRCENHFAACARCRKIIAVLAASDDSSLAEKEVARLGELVAAARAPREVASQTAKPSRPNRWDWRTRWLAPALGVAAVLAVWFAMRPPWRAGDQGGSGTLIAQAPKSESLPPAEGPPVDQLSKVAPQKSIETDGAVRKDRPAERAESPNPATESFARNRAADSNAITEQLSNAGPAGDAVRDEKKEQTELKTAPAAAPPPPPPPPAPRAQVRITGEVSAGAVGSAPSGDKEQPAAQGAAGGTVGGVGSPRVSTDMPMNGRSFSALSLSKATAKGTVLIKAPSGINLWRAGKTGSIERSTDAGQTWRAQASPLRDDWLAGAAASDTVCWLAGRNGAIARTTDGERWERTIPPAQAAASGKLPDWTSVTASDAQTAMIMSSDGRRYSTQDGGKTWQEQ